MSRPYYYYYCIMYMNTEIEEMAGFDSQEIFRHGTAVSKGLLFC